MSIRSFIVALAMITSVACGGDSGTANFLSGNIKGQPLQVKDVVSGPGQILAGSATRCTTSAACPAGETCVDSFCGQRVNVGTLIMSDTGGLCDKFGQHPPLQPRNTKYLVFLLADFNSTTGQFSAPVASGTYPVISGGQAPAKLALVYYRATDGNCIDPATTAPVGRSGTVVLTSAINSSYAGTFDILLESDHITGSFNSTYCSALAALYGSTPATCVDR